VEIDEALNAEQVFEPAKEIQLCASAAGASRANAPNE
jgi:hypothetical protein